MREVDQQQFHPNYLDPDADAVLGTNEGIKFRVHSVILKKGARVLHDQWELARRQASWGNDGFYRFEETADILATLLNIISPEIYVPLQLLSADYAFELYQAAVKYDMKKAQAVIRKQAMEDRNIGEKPLEVYVLACRLRWEDEMKLASTRSLDVNLNTPDSLGVLRKLDRVEDLINLHSLHHTRRENFKALLKSIPNDRIIGKCRNGCIPHPPLPRFINDREVPRNDNEWRGVFDSTLLGALERHLSGEEIRSPDFWVREELQDMWTMVCPRCSQRLADKGVIVAMTKNLLDQLPSSV